MAGSCPFSYVLRSKLKWKFLYRRTTEATMATSVTRKCIYPLSYTPELIKWLNYEWYSTTNDKLTIFAIISANKIIHACMQMHVIWFMCISGYINSQNHMNNYTYIRIYCIVDKLWLLIYMTLTVISTSHEEHISSGYQQLHSLPWQNYTVP